MTFCEKLPVGAAPRASKFPRLPVAKILCHRAGVALFSLCCAGNTAWGSSVRLADALNSSTLKLNAAEVGAFADRQLPVAMRKGDIPGAVFVVVRGDRVLFRKGYGLADIENRRRVSTSNTLFRVASISKILTAASALQLVHQHLLRLHRNVNRYFAHFRIAPAFGVPITLFDLLTHSSGFDVCQLDYAARTEAQKLSLRHYLTEFQPVRVRPPGLFSGYDNYGYALAGYLVQKASGVPFPEYVEKHVLQPLGMDHSSFTPDSTLRRELATGYWLEDGTLRPYRQTHVNITPAAGLCSTASDMSQFLMALLADCRPNGERAFPSSVLRGLETQQLAFDREVPGRCYGFDEVMLKGHLVLRQTGQWPGFNSLLLLFPRQHCGMFIAYNRCDQLSLGSQISHRFAEQFLSAPKPVVATKPIPSSGPDALKSLCGYYLSLRFPQDSPDLGIPPGLEVTQGSVGQLEIGGRSYREIKPLVFEQFVPSGIPGRCVAFRLGQHGRVADLITDGGAFREVPWSETRQGRRWLIRAATALFLSVVILWPIVLVVRSLGTHMTRGHAASAAHHRFGWFSRLAQGMGLAACALALWFEVALALAETRLGPFGDFYGLPSSMVNLLGILPLLIVLTVVLVIFSMIAWRIHLWSFARRLHFSLIPAALAVFLYVFHWQHLLLIAFSNRGLS